MSIYVKTQGGATPLQTPQLRYMKVGTGQDTLERADKVSTIICSLTMGISYHPTGIPDSTQPARSFWIDLANSFIRRHSGSIVYPIPYVNPRSWEDSISCRLQDSGKLYKLLQVLVVGLIMD